MAISWGTIKSLLLFFGPVLLPRALAAYRNIRSAPRVHGLVVRPAPAAVSRALFVLAAVALVFLAKTLPILSPENIFQVTQSRLQIPVDVLFNRLSALRPNGGVLTASDTALRARFVNLESRLLYLQFGPAVLADCPFCKSDEPMSYFYYALPDLLAPHLLNLVILALVTSPLFAGREAAPWRSTATLAAVAAAAADISFVYSYNVQANSRALKLGEIDFFFWRARAYRALALAALDGAVGWLLWLSATNRAFASPPTAAERVETVTRALAGAKSRLNAVGIVKNTAIRDEELRARSHMYWGHEVRMTQTVMEEREVIEGVTDALQNRIDIQTISRDAESYANSVLRAPDTEPTVVG